jgi:hypothetical protein
MAIWRVARALKITAACSTLALAGVFAVPAAATAQPTVHSVRAAAASGPQGCPAPTAGQVSCAAAVAPGSTAVTEATLQATDSLPAGYGPLALRYAYGLDSSSITGGVGQTVAVVTAYDDATAETDMATYRSEYSIPPCGTGCFSKVNETGGDTYPPAGPQGWSLTAAESLDMISAVCPNCHILLVEATTTAISDLGAAENEAVALGANFVTNTWFNEESFYGSSEPGYDSEYFDHPGVAITAPDGNGGGYGSYYPAASPDVIAVGGTALTQDTAAPRGWTEAAWSGTGSGCSPYEAKPAWQTDTGCSDRTLNDMSAVASTNTAVAFYDSNSGGWVTTGGNNAASALIAADYALAGPPAAGTNPASYAYAHTGAFNDITTGSDGTCTPAYLCTAGPGYDGPTGIGTPASAAALGALAPSESLPGAPAYYNPGPGDQDLMGTGTSGTEFVDSRSSTSGTWSGWTNLNGAVVGASSAIFNPASGNFEVYARETTGELAETYWEAASDKWSGWIDMDAPSSAAPVAAYNPLNSTLDVFETAGTGTEFVRTWSATGGWSGWTNLGGDIVGSPAAAYDPAAGSMQVFGTGTSGAVYVDSWTSARGWSGWTSLGGGIAGTVAVVYDPASGNFEVYGRETTDELAEVYWEAASDKWSGWIDMDAPSSATPAAAYNPLNNTLDVFETASTGTEFVRTWSATGGWSGWTNLSGDIDGTVAAAYDPNSNAMEIYGLAATNSGPYVDSWTPAGWSSWRSLGGTLGNI